MLRDSRIRKVVWPFSEPGHIIRYERTLHFRKGGSDLLFDFLEGRVVYQALVVRRLDAGRLAAVLVSTLTPAGISSAISMRPNLCITR